MKQLMVTGVGTPGSPRTTMTSLSLLRNFLTSLPSLLFSQCGEEAARVLPGSAHCPASSCTLLKEKLAEETKAISGLATHLPSLHLQPATQEGTEPLNGPRRKIGLSLLGIPRKKGQTPPQPASCRGSTQELAFEGLSSLLFTFLSVLPWFGGQDRENI